MPLNLSSPPDLPDLNSPGTYNQRVLDSFTYVFQTLVSELTALTPEDFFQVMSSLSDTTPEVLLKNGAHGLGADTRQVKNHDWNDAEVSGLFHSDSVGLNKPDFASNFAGISLRRSDTLHAQLAIALNSGVSQNARTAVRAKTGPTSWSDWFEIYTQTSILGTVSQSGGVPTGAIIERGGNANGEYVRLADGTQICTRQVTPDYSLHNSRQQYIYPASFSNVPKVWTGYSIQGNGNTAAWDASDDLFVFGSLATQQWEVVQRKSGQPSSAVPINLIAIGRWF
ncbi:MAG: pyocin knob domain-containing protein [Epibacterium sp.]